MRILAIESSCDETAVAIVEDGRRVLTDCIASQVALHREYGGVVPEIASRKHIEAIYGLAEQALENTGLTRGELDAVAVTYAPGLIGALLVGVNFAKAAALALDVPLIPVHHIKGHIAANYLAYPDLEPPFLCLVVSGGHTMFVDVEDYTKLRILGGTRDDAAGECFDKVARLLGMPYPGGAALDRAAQGGDPSRYPMPRPHLSGNPLDLSFSGLKTSAVNLIHNAGQKGEQIVIPDLCAAFSEAVCGMLVPRAMLALEHPIQADVVIGVPDSGLDAALGYSQQSGIPYGIGFLKNKYIGRTFIQPNQKLRENTVRIKLNPIADTVKGRRVVLVDDSIVRGTTSRQIVQMLREAGATEVHFLSSAPEFLYPCYFGVDVDSRENLIAANHSLEEMREILGVDSLGFLSVDGVKKIAEGCKCGLCTGCFTGKYPVEPPKSTEKSKFEKKISENIND